MALHDHFHPPLSKHRHWHGFHNAWATYIAADLNHRLPEGYFAEPNVQFGIEIDVATFEECSPNVSGSVHENFPASKNLQIVWEPPPPEQTVPFEPATEAVEVSIFHTEEGPTLTGVIELVSPANKDRKAHREAFVSKCEAYLQYGLGLVIIDVVTARTGNLHNELIERIATSYASLLHAALYTGAYHVVQHHEQPSLDIWSHALEIGHTLPTMPLWLRGDICYPLELNSTYELTCREQRISINTSG